MAVAAPCQPPDGSDRGGTRDSRWAHPSWIMPPTPALLVSRVLLERPRRWRSLLSRIWVPLPRRGAFHTPKCRSVLIQLCRGGNRCKYAAGDLIHVFLRPMPLSLLWVYPDSCDQRRPASVIPQAACRPDTDYQFAELPQGVAGLREAGAAEGNVSSRPAGWVVGGGGSRRSVLQLPLVSSDRLH